MKFKKLSKSQIKISIDRLTRFKSTEEKYIRVFSDIILSNLIEPKLKKRELLGLPYSDIRNLAEEIFNNSLPQKSGDYYINTYLKKYENLTFNNTESTQILLENKFDYKTALSYVDCDDVLNLVWLKNISENTDIITLRKEKKLLYPVEKVIIAEGITEEILLPEFSKFCGYDFEENGVKIISAGGKNQVVKLYYKLCEELKLPIFILLDNDAESNKKAIISKLRDKDEIYLLDSGEFEDLLPKTLIKKTINNEFKNFIKITTKELNTDSSMVKTLEELFKEKCLHEFKKAEFAQRVKQQISSERDISPELKHIIFKISNF